MMNTGPIQFEKQFSQLKSRLRSASAADLRLMSMVGFWPTLRPMLGNRSFDSHTEEYIATLVEQCRGGNLDDLRIAELETIHGILASLHPMANRYCSRDDFSGAEAVIDTEWARKLLYVGQTEAGVRILEESLNRVEASDISGMPELPDGVDELDALRLINEARADRTDPASRRIRSILVAWEMLREGLSHSEVACLFVEKHGDRVLSRGRMRLLQAVAEYHSAAATSHEVTFEHQIRSPDDPFVGSIYDALVAVQKLLAGPAYRKRRGEYVHAHFQIMESDHPFTGDSIGLAAALVTLIQLLSTEVLRHEQGIASCAVFTGGIDSEGRVCAVNGDSLEFKVERAFCSPAKFLVLPRENLRAAQDCVEKLNAEYPRRRLALIPAERFEEVAGDRNVVRSEKVCAGQYVIRKAGSYSRLARIQVPLLLALVYVLACIVYPKAWIGFDWEPEYVWLNETKDRINVYNEDTTLLWQAPVVCPPGDTVIYASHDLDHDGGKEVIYMTKTYESVPCSTSAQLVVCGSDGDVRYTRRCNIVGEYPGDSVESQYYIAARLWVFDLSVGTIIVTDVAESYPGRSHIRIWSADGELLGWYVHAGHPRDIYAWDVDGDGAEELVGVAINNPMESMGIFVIPARGAFGVSPPYKAPGLDLDWVRHGNQLYYTSLPTSDITRADGIPYNTAVRLAMIGTGGIRLDIHEAFNGSAWRSFFIDPEFRVTQVRLSDVYWSGRLKYVEDRRLPPVDKAEYIEEQLDSVLYWSDTGWVSEAELRAQANVLP